jgi:hypothetical protein
VGKTGLREYPATVGGIKMIILETEDRIALCVLGNERSHTL